MFFIVVLKNKAYQNILKKKIYQYLNIKCYLLELFWQHCGYYFEKRTCFIMFIFKYLFCLLDSVQEMMEPNAHYTLFPFVFIFLKLLLFIFKSRKTISCKEYLRNSQEDRDESEKPTSGCWGVPLIAHHYWNNSRLLKKRTNKWSLFTSFYDTELHSQ